MPTIEYPQELTKKRWEKKKPVMAKGKKTGIGEKLSDLEHDHEHVHWDQFTPPEAFTLLDTKLAEWPRIYAHDVEPLAKAAKEVKELAKEWAVEFKKDKMMPKSAVAAAEEVADAANRYMNEVLEFEGVEAKALSDARKQLMQTLRAQLGRMFAKNLAKIEGLLKDIPTFARNPTKENFFSIFKSDCNARGYTTACKNWDQYLKEFPDIRDQCFRGKAMDEFFPGMADYGAEWSEEDFEKKVNPKTGLTGPACYVWHAKHLLREIPNIRRFKGVIEQLLQLLRS